MNLLKCICIIRLYRFSVFDSVLKKTYCITVYNNIEIVLIETDLMKRTRNTFNRKKVDI